MSTNLNAVEDFMRVPRRVGQTRSKGERKKTCLNLKFLGMLH